MKFAKMHGIGNDYVFVNGFKETVLQPEKLARMISDRHFGIGSDGLIIIGPAARADFEMVMYNADGSRGEMCGNGIRCLAKYVYEKKLTEKKIFTVETPAGIRETELIFENQRITAVKVAMGEPEFQEEQIPVWGNYPISCISMGNPHCVVFVDVPAAQLKIEEIGPRLEHHPCFPHRTNVEFVNVINRKELQMRVWERGSGETLACGTGACAAAAAAIARGYTENTVTVRLLGGALEICWDRKKRQIYMTGPAELIYEGVISLPKGLE